MEMLMTKVNVCELVVTIVIQVMLVHLHFTLRHHLSGDHMGMVSIRFYIRSLAYALYMFSSERFP